MTECKLYRKEEGWAVAVPLSNEWMDFLPVFSLPRAFMVSWTASSLFLTSSSATLLVILQRLLFTFCKWKFISKVWDQKAHAVLFIWRAEDFYKQSSFQHWFLPFFVVIWFRVNKWKNEWISMNWLVTSFSTLIVSKYEVSCTFICKKLRKESLMLTFLSREIFGTWKGIPKMKRRCLILGQKVSK